MICARLTRDAADNIDLLLTDGVFEMAGNGTAVACALQARLSEYRDECEASVIVDTAVDPLRGVDYYGIIFASDKSQAEKELELRRVILTTPGVQGILAWSWTQVDHTVTIDVTVQTQWGAVTLTTTVEPL